MEYDKEYDHREKDLPKEKPSKDAPPEGFPRHLTESDALTDTERAIHHQLRSLSHRFRQMSDSRGGQKQILFLLTRQDEISQRKLMDLTGIKSGSLSEVLGKLERAGLIERTPSEEDHRSVNIHLTDEGRRQAAANHDDFNANLVNMYACLTMEEKDTLLALLMKLNAAWQKQIETDPDAHRRHHGPDGRNECHGHGRGHRHHEDADGEDNGFSRKEEES